MGGTTSLMFRTLPTGHRGRGQALTEFALLLPVMFALATVVLDVSRVYQVWISLESATRDAAEYVATTQTSSGDAAEEARRIVCLGLKNSVGFDPGTSSDGSECVQPAVSLDSFVVSTTMPGATARNPIGAATVSASLAFQTIIPFPFNGGTFTVRAQESFQIVQGR